jgi:hypothetical protein
VIFNYLSYYKKKLDGFVFICSKSGRVGIQKPVPAPLRDNSQNSIFSSKEIFEKGGYVVI